MYYPLSLQTPVSPRIFNFPDSHEEFAPNIIKTSHYTWYNFIFLNLFEQFHRFANIFFLFLAIIQAIPSISPLNQIAGFTQLIFMLSITGVKNAYEDILRHRADKKVNDTKTKVYQKSFNDFVDKKWSEIKVSDVIKIEPNDEVPADCVIIKTVGKDNRCRIETAALDGETNLKYRYPVEKFGYNSSVYNDAEINFNKSCVFEISPPNSNLSSFSGKIYYEDEVLIVSNSNFIPRGCVLKDSNPITAVVVYSGEDTKIILNSIKPRFKFSELDRIMSRMAVVLLIAMFAICLILTICGKLWNESFDEGYMQLDIKKWYLQWFSWIIDLQMIIPLAVYSSLDIVRLLISFNVMLDENMSHQNCKSKCKNSDLVSTIGRVSHIFSDKTGTLTKNLMTMKAVSLSNITFGCVKETLTPRNKFVSISDSNIEYFRINFDKDDDIWYFLMTIILCNSADIENYYEGNINNNNEGNIMYISNSPDEHALLEFAKECGFLLLNNEKDHSIISIHGKIYNIEKPISFEFSSERKMSSVICKLRDRWVLLAKGADSVIFERSNNVSANLRQNLNRFGSCGFRTMCFAKRFISNDEMEKIFNEYHTCLSNPNGAEQLINSLALNKVEINLEVYGISGLEDELQDNVIDCINKIKCANIKTWVLTGDRLDSAVHIASQCGILKKEDTIIYSNYSDLIGKQIIPDNSLAIDCKDLINNSDMLFDILPDFSSVVVSRCEPLQKGNIIRLFKEKNPKSIILTIGDGANDVDMIRCADVGVGLEGREGSSAVLSSDFSIPTFCKLSRLLIVHGRFNCNRTSLLVLVTFYKNLLLGLPQLFYGFSNGFTATSIFDSGFFAMYNAVLTVPQHFIACALEEDLSPSLCLKFPEVYKDYQNNGGFTLLRLFWFYLIAFIHSALIYFIPVYSLESSLLNEKGTPLDHSLLTQIVGWSLMCVFTYEMFHIFHCITILHILLNIFCFFSNFIIQFLYAKVDDEYHEILNRCSDVYLMWITIPLIVGACVILDMCKELIKSFYAQNKSDKLRLLGMNKMKK